MLSDAFNALFSVHSRQVTIDRVGVTAVTTRIMPSNFYRTTKAISEIVIEGKEFLLSKKSLDEVNWTLKRGDRIHDSELGELAITDIEEIFDLGAKVMGYRIKTG